MDSGYSLDEMKGDGFYFQIPEIKPFNDEKINTQDLLRIIQPKFDPHQALKGIEHDLSFGILSDLNRPDRSPFIRPREEENQMWDQEYDGRMAQIDAAEQRYQQMVSSAAENGQIDSFNANSVLFGIGTVAGPFEKQRREARELYHSGRKF